MELLNEQLKDVSSWNDYARIHIYTKPLCLCTSTYTQAAPSYIVCLSVFLTATLKRGNNTRGKGEGGKGCPFPPPPLPSINPVYTWITCYILFHLQERSRSGHLQSELRSQTVSQKAMVELQEMLRDLRAERDLLKQANDRLRKGWANWWFMNQYCLQTVHEFRYSWDFWTFHFRLTLRWGYM